MKKYLILLTALFIVCIISCKDDEPELSNAPTSSDASFTYTVSTESPNTLSFTAASSGGILVWDFDNGLVAKGKTATTSFPKKGTYNVTLTIFVQGGSASTTQSIVIENDDFSLLDDPLYTMLTGGIDSTNGKTWVIDSATVGHFGVGPNPVSVDFGYFPEYYAANPNEKAGAGFYNDRYTFKLDGFQYDMVTNGDVYLNSNQANAFPGSYDPGVGDLTAPFPDQLGESWTLTYENVTDTTIATSGSSFIGYNTGVNLYKIVSITENELFLSYEDINSPDLLWYIRLIPEGYVPSVGGNTGATLPIDFDNNAPTFTGFGNSTASIIDNPDPRINTSAKVLETIHGDEAWAGVSVELENKLDFSSDSSISVKVWAPSAGDTLKIKLEDKSNSSISIEADVVIPAGISWVTRTINFGALGAAANTYDKIALFPGWNKPNGGTYYLDDIAQE